MLRSLHEVWKPGYQVQKHICYMSKRQRFLNINVFQLLSSDLGPIDRISWISCSDALACKASKVCCHKSARPGWCQRRELQKRTWHRLRMLRISHNANLYSLYLFILFLYLVSLWDRLWFMFFTHFKINQSRQSLLSWVSWRVLCNQLLAMRWQSPVRPWTRKSSFAIAWCDPNNRVNLRKPEHRRPV